MPSGINHFCRIKTDAHMIKKLVEYSQSINEGTGQSLMRLRN
jgi:hypothetical protein